MKLILNDIEADGISGDVVMSFVSNNLKDIATRNGNYSNNFNLALTNNNKRIFESAEVLSSLSEVTYTKLTAKIIVDGLEVVNGFAVLNESGDSYDVSIFSGVTLFIDAIKEFSIESIKDSFTSLDHPWTTDEIESRRQTKENIVYPNIDYGHFELSNSYSATLDYIYPSVYAKYVIDKTLEFLDYRKVGAFWSGEVYQNLALPCYRLVDRGNFLSSWSREFSSGDLSGVETYFTFDEIESDDDNQYQIINIPGIGDVGCYVFSADPDTRSYALECSGEFKAAFHEIFSAYPIVDVELRIIDRTTGTQVGTALAIQYGDFEPTYSFDFVSYSLSDLNLVDFTTDVLVWWFKVTPSATKPLTTMANFETTSPLTFSIKETLSLGERFVRVYDSLPEFKISDLLKSILNIEGVFLIVSDENKTLTAYYYDDIRSNKSKAYDWSDLLDLSEKPVITYRFNEYAQESTFNYQNDDKDVYLTEDLDYGEGVLSIADTTLEKRKKVIDIPFGLCSIGTTCLNAAVPITMARIWTGVKWIDGGLDFSQKTDKFKNRLVQLVDSNSPIYVEDDTIRSRDVVPSINFDKVIPKRYGLIQDITNKTKIVNCLFNLKVNDIYEFDFSRPVYVSYLNEYFFVNEIKQFKFNRSESTLVELIRI